MEVLRKYGVSATILFPLVDAGAQDFESTPVTFAAGDTKIIKDEGAAANTTNNPTHEGNGIYSLVLTATEMQAARIVVTLIDSATKAWEDQAVVLATYGNASAEHAFDLDTATVTADALGTQAKADVNAEVEDVIGVDANTELATVPASTADMRKMVQYLFEYFRNKKTVTATTETLYKEDAATSLGTATVSDDGTTFTKGEMG